MNDQQIQIGNAIREIRDTVGASQQEVADALGVTVNFISQVENGRRTLSSVKMETLASFFQIPISFIYVLADDGRKRVVGLLQNLVYKSLAIAPTDRRVVRKRAVRN